VPERDGSAEPLVFDLVIVGGGSGNSIINREFSHLSIALIDDGEHFGGTCLNAGCIPTKMLVHVADVTADAADAAPLGATIPDAVVDWSAIRHRVFGRTDRVSEAGFRNRDEKIPNVTVFRESFRFESLHELVSTSGLRVHGHRVVIAAGSRPRELDVDIEPGPDLHDSTSIMRIAELPKSLVILGGGAVAVEFAHVFSAMGVRVTQVARAPRLLDGLDADVAAAFTARAATQWAVVTGAKVRSIDRAEALTVRLDTGETIVVSAVLVAVGRVSNTDVLGLGSLGIDLHPDGRIAVDDEQRVLSDGAPVEGIFALGDVSSAWQLKHVANHEARVVQHNLLNPENPVGGAPGPVPAAIFSRPQVAHFGLTERDAPGAVVITRDYSTTAWGWALEDTSSFCKLVIDPDTGRLLGAHVIGPEASTLIQPLVMAASLGLSVRGLARSMYWPHPSATEIVENALLDAESKLDQIAQKVSTKV
jgi:mycothione reductase